MTPGHRFTANRNAKVGATTNTQALNVGVGLRTEHLKNTLSLCWVFWGGGLLRIEYVSQTSWGKKPHIEFEGSHFNGKNNI